VADLIEGVGAAAEGPAGPAEPPEPPPTGGEGEPIADCARLDQNDTDTGKRLLRHFGPDLLHVRDIGWHVWTGDHWEAEGGQEAIERLAQETARRIKEEAAWLNPSPADLDVIQAAAGLRELPADQLDAGQRALLLAAVEAETRLAKRREGRRKFAISPAATGRAPWR